MSTRLPPLNALRTFEAAARHLSFTRAAEELFVTQAAVSHQIRTLEEHLGVPLFRRLNRRLMLTEGVFSMDGDRAPLARLAELCLRHDAYLVVVPQFVEGRDERPAYLGIQRVHLLRAIERQ